MQILIKGTNIQITPAINDYIEKKIGGLRKYLQRLDSPAVMMRVEVGRTTAHHRKGEIFRAEANLAVPGRLIRAEEENDDLYTAIDLMHDGLKREIISFKEKTIAKRIRPARR